MWKIITHKEDLREVNQMSEIGKLRFMLYAAMNKDDKDETLRLSRMLDKKIVSMMREIMKREQLKSEKYNL